jgi:hypothetical protein
MVDQMRTSWNSLLSWLREVGEFERLGARASSAELESS